MKKVNIIIHPDRTVNKPFVQDMNGHSLRSHYRRAQIVVIYLDCNELTHKRISRSLYEKVNLLLLSVNTESLDGIKILVKLARQTGLSQ